MECDVDGKCKDDGNSVHSSIKAAIDLENPSLKKSCNGKRKRKRPRTKAFRRTIREKIEIALCTSNSPIHDILKADKDCVVSAPLSSIIRLLKLDTDEYRRLTCKALISIGALSKFFSIVGNSMDSLQLVLKSSDLDHSSTIVYVDNLPHGCKVDPLEKWASTFGTIVFVHPIMARKMNPNKGAATNDVSVSTEASLLNGRFFRSAFIKFVDDQSSADFIKFHQSLRKKAASRRRKKLKLERLKMRKRNSVSTIRSKNKMQRKRRKKKRKTQSTSETQLQKDKTDGEAMETEINDDKKPAVVMDNSNGVVNDGGGNYSRRRKRKRQSSREVDNILVKRSKGITDEEKKVGTEDAKPNGFKSNDSEKAVGICVTEKDHKNKDVKMEIGDRSPHAKNTQQLKVIITDQSSKKTFRDIGTDVPEDLLSIVDGVGKKRKRVHRQKRRDDKPKNCSSHPKKYFHNIQAYSLDTFQKLRTKYLELQKQQMIQLKASLKKKSLPVALSGLTRKEWRKKRGRCRLMMRAAKLHEEYVDLCHYITEEDKLADAQI